MSDYGHDIEFGYFLTPDAGDPQGVLETARLADRLGYDLLAVQDHPYQPAHLHALALVGVIPTFFINGRRHHGAYDIDTLSRPVRTAGARAKLTAS